MGPPFLFADAKRYKGFSVRPRGIEPYLDLHRFHLPAVCRRKKGTPREQMHRFPQGPHCYVMLMPVPVQPT